MKITIKTEQTKEVNITFPHYRINKNIGWYYAIWSEKKLTVVRTDAISESGNIAIAFGENDKECTQHEFMTAYEELVDKIVKGFEDTEAYIALLEDKHDDEGTEYNPETETMDGL